MNSCRRPQCYMYVGDHSAILGDHSAILGDHSVYMGDHSAIYATAVSVIELWLRKFFKSVKALLCLSYTKTIVLKRVVSRQNIALGFASCYICLLHTLFRAIFFV